MLNFSIHNFINTFFCTITELPYFFASTNYYLKASDTVRKTIILHLFFSTKKTVENNNESKSKSKISSRSFCNIQISKRNLSGSNQPATSDSIGKILVSYFFFLELFFIVLECGEVFY